MKTDVDIGNAIVLCYGYANRAMTAFLNDSLNRIAAIRLYDVSQRNAVGEKGDAADFERERPDSPRPELLSTALHSMLSKISTNNKVGP